MFKLGNVEGPKLEALYKDTNLALSHLMSEIETGNLALPDIQRPFVWSNTKIRDLFDSLYKGFPVGTLMFWETGTGGHSRQIGSGDKRAPGKLIIDGQQRLTSLYTVLKGEPVLDKNYRKREVKLAFNPITETFEVPDAAILRNPRFVPDITQFWTDGYRRRSREFLKRLKTVDEFSENELDRFEERLDRVRDLQGFRFQIIELTDAANVEDISDIFVRINSKGVSLQQTDFILTLMSVHWEEGRRDLERFARSASDPAAPTPNARNSFITPKADQLLRTAIGYGFKRGRLSSAYNVLRGRNDESGQYTDADRDANFEVLATAQADVLNLQNWHDYLAALQWAGFTDSSMISSEVCLLYCYMFWLIGRKEFGVSQEQLRGLIGRYFFMAHTTRRYTSSPESTVEMDLNRLKGLKRSPERFAAALEALIKANFTDDYWAITMPTRLDSSSARSPEFLAYIASLNSLDADVLLSKTRIRDLLVDSAKGVRTIERHHLFPKAYLKSKGIEQRRRNSIANYAFVEWPRNLEIGSRAPSDYWPSITAKLKDQDRLHRQMSWHALPPDWQNMPYDEFLSERRKLMARNVAKAFAKLSEDKTLVEDDVPEFDRQEGQHLEFKSTFRTNLHTNQPDKRMEHAVAKTVAGFMNSQGGRLLIGVDDEGQTLGLDPDFKTMGKQGNIDGFELALRKRLRDQLSLPITGLVKVAFRNDGDNQYCELEVLPGSRPIYCAAVGDAHSHHEFYVRDGNATTQLFGADQLAYAQRHWN